MKQEIRQEFVEDVKSHIDSWGVKYGLTRKEILQTVMATVMFIEVDEEE